MLARAVDAEVAAWIDDPSSNESFTPAILPPISG